MTQTDTGPQPQLGWHFATDAGTTNPQYSGKDVRIEAGTVFESPGEPVVCGPFPHCCWRAIDALAAGHGAVVSRVAVSGHCVEGDAGKVAVNRREHLWVADATVALRPFIVWLLVDEQAGAIRYADRRGAAPIRDVAALHQRLIDGSAVTSAEWAAAADAAWAAARAAAEAAAEAAAWAAARAAGDAAWAAARAAAEAAAEAAAWAAARAAGDAAWAAARAAGAAAWAAGDAAWAAARAAARAAQNTKLEEFLLALAPDATASHTKESTR